MFTGTVRRCDMKSRDTKSINMIWIVMFIMAAAPFIQGDSYAADNIYKPPAVDERRDREEDLYKGLDNKAREEDLYQSEPVSSRPAAEEAGLETERPNEVAVEKIKAGEWKIIKPNGNPAGRLITRQGGGYIIFDTNNLNMGAIFEDGIWRPRDAARKSTNVGPQEVQLYLYALDAIEKVKSTE